MIADRSSACDRWLAYVHVTDIIVSDRCTVCAPTGLICRTKACTRRKQGDVRPPVISQLHSQVGAYKTSRSESFIFTDSSRSHSFQQARSSAFTRCELDEAERRSGGGRGELIMLIIICGCDVLKCKAHLNPAANYRMFCGGVSAAEAGLGLSRGLKHKNWHQLNVKSVITGEALFCHVPNKMHK